MTGIHNDANIYVFGDTILDHLTIVEPRRICQEDPHALIYEKIATQTYYGGAANVAMNLQALGENIQFVSRAAPTEVRVISDHQHDAWYRQIASAMPRGSYFFPTQRNVIEHKERLVGTDGRYLLRMDKKLSPLPFKLPWKSGADGSEMLMTLLLKQPPTLVVADYGKGFVSADFLKALNTALLASPWQVPLLVGVHSKWNSDFAELSYSRVSYKMNVHEALGLCRICDDTQNCCERPLSDHFDEVTRWQREVLIATSTALKQFLLPFQYLVITFGAFGLGAVGSDPEAQCVTLYDPTPVAVKDVCGAGDVVLACLAQALTHGAVTPEAISRGASAAFRASRMAIQRLGTCVITPEDRKKLRDHPE